jgi:hypothetical protein
VQTAIYIRYVHSYFTIQTMSLLMIDFTYLEIRDGELVVKELAAADSHCNKISSYVFKRSYSWEDVPIFNAE